MAVPTLAAIRARWTALTEAMIGDTDLTTLRTEAGNRIPTGLSDDDDTNARIHLTAHLTLGFLQGSTLASMVSGTVAAQSASFIERSITRQASASTTITPRSTWEAELLGTAPGRLYLSIVSNTMPDSVYYGAPW